MTLAPIGDTARAMLLSGTFWLLACEPSRGPDAVEPSSFDLGSDQAAEVMQSDVAETVECPPDDCGIGFDVSQTAGSAVVTAFTTSSCVPSVYQVWFFGSDGMTMEIPGMGATLAANRGLSSGLAAIGPVDSQFVIRANCTGREVRWAIVRLLVEKCATPTAVAFTINCG